MRRTHHVLTTTFIILSLINFHLSTFPDEAYLTLESLAATLDKYNSNAQPFFIAFYDREDLESSNRMFIANVYQACLANSEYNVRFFIYGDQIPETIRDKYFLHYYTLPKLKFFGPDGVETYFGGPHLKAIDAWIKRKFRDEL